jgi:hypothetical protein
MKCFHCDSCGLMVFFQNDHCEQCGHRLGFLPDVLALSALETVKENQLQATLPATKGRIYRNCANESQFQVCNWMVPDEDPNTFCAACRLNEIIPDLTNAKNVDRWKKLELAKRYSIYTFLKLGLPIEGSADGKLPPLRFRFLEDKENAPVKTGHENGLITLNIAEADADEREHRRVAMHEPYRTLVGHFRHESGHFYWDRLIANSPNLENFRKLFGDETADYGVALQNYYKSGPRAGWAAEMVSAYASSHPWEDWAETWAHYLHIMDTLETAAGFGVGVDNNGKKNTRVKFHDRMDFDALLAEWIPLTCALNTINRGMGLPDLYPFVIPPPVVEKLRFIHRVTHEN